MFPDKKQQELVLFLLCEHPAKFDSLKHVICLGTISCLSKLWMHRGYFNEKRMHLFSASTSAVVGSAIALANSLLANCNSIRSADKYARLMTLELYDVASCGESLTVRELSLGRSPGVFAPLLFVCKPDFLINSSGCLESASISRRSGAFPNGGTIHRGTQFRNRTSHGSRSCCLGPNDATCFTSECLLKSSLNESVLQARVAKSSPCLRTLMSLTGCLYKHGLNTPML